MVDSFRILRSTILLVFGFIFYLDSTDLGFRILQLGRFVVLFRHHAFWETTVALVHRVLAVSHQKTIRTDNYRHHQWIFAKHSRCQYCSITTSWHLVCIWLPWLSRSRICDHDTWYSIQWCLRWKKVVNLSWPTLQPWPQQQLRLQLWLQLQWLQQQLDLLKVEREEMREWVSVFANILKIDLNVYLIINVGI